jgi:hypothetical protein
VEPHRRRRPPRGGGHVAEADIAVEPLVDAGHVNPAVIAARVGRVGAGRPEKPQRVQDRLGRLDPPDAYG